MLYKFLQILSVRKALDSHFPACQQRMTKNKMPHEQLVKSK